MNAVTITIAVRCNWCSKQKPEFRVHRLTTGQVICDDCLDWHMHALDVMGGNMPRGCQECGAAWEQVLGAEQMRVYIVQKDGIYQVLCRACIQSYTPKRGDLYKGTRYGKSIDL
jgi:hypothetical protein